MVVPQGIWGSIPQPARRRPARVAAIKKEDGNMSVPTSLNVGGVFASTHKYSSSAAMLLDFCEFYDAETGSVHENGTHARYFIMNIESAYKLVNGWILYGVHGMVNADFTTIWWDIRQMIDILSDGQFWVVTTDSQGFVDANCYETNEKAWDAFSLVEHDYMKANGEFEPCGVCGEYGHRDKTHDDDDEYTGPTYPEFDE